MNDLGGGGGVSVAGVLHARQLKGRKNDSPYIVIYLMVNFAIKKVQ
jgi:hypothetical protein